MKSLTLLLIFSLAVVCPVNAQEGKLVLSKIGEKRERSIYAGKKIGVYTIDERHFSGHLGIIDSSSITVGTDTLPISGIEAIVARTSGTRTTGAILTGIGSFALIGGLAIMNNNENTGTLSGNSIQMGPEYVFLFVGTLTTLSGIRYFAFGMKYQKQGWNFSTQQ
jgi:hypothetical protein